MWSALCSMGNVLHSQGKFPEALEVHNKALVIYLKIHGHMHPHVAGTLGNISNVYQAQGKFPEALETFKKVLNIFEKIHGHMHLDVATTYMKYGIVIFFLK